MDTDVFISYTQPDRIQAFSVHDLLQANKINSWIAPSAVNGIPTGENYETPIVEAIRSCKIFILIHSAAANKSPHIANEIRLRDPQKKTFIIKLDNSGYDPVLLYHIKDVQTPPDPKKDWNERLYELLTLVKKSLSSAAAGVYESSDKLLLSLGLKLLESKSYTDAEQHLAQYVNIEPGNSFARFALALSIIKGRKCRKLHGLEVKKLENILMPALTAKNNSFIRVLLAIIKYGYYTCNGFSETSPSAIELVAGFSPEKDKDMMILTHLADPDNMIWSELRNLYKL